MSKVYPVYDNTFEIEISADTMAPIAEMETFSVSIDNGIEEWNPMEAKGWVKRLLTSKSLSVSLSGKRCFGDPGNDYVAGLAWAEGLGANSKFKWIMPDSKKTTVEIDCVVNVTTFGGDSTAVDALEIEILSNGKPKVTQDGVEINADETE